MEKILSEVNIEYPVYQSTRLWLSLSNESIEGFLSIMVMVVIDNNSMPLWIRQAHHERLELSFKKCYLCAYTKMYTMC